MEAINWFQSYQFDRVSPFLGSVKMTVTVINTENQSHNIIPSQCSFVVDIRLTEMYTHEELLEIIRQYVKVHITPRSMRLRSTLIPEAHPVVEAGKRLGKKVYGSPTSSDKALLPIPALKCGPGFSGQSHAADEFIALADIRNGIELYINLVSPLAAQST
jgi:acetylornithine deacetylase